jgi:hypothetical protein
MSCRACRGVAALLFAFTSHFNTVDFLFKTVNYLLENSTILTTEVKTVDYIPEKLTVLNKRQNVLIYLHLFMYLVVNIHKHIWLYFLLHHFYHRNHLGNYLYAYVCSCVI